MGRGSQSRAVTAQGLLYGRRQRGQGPASASASRLPWASFVTMVKEVCYQASIIVAPSEVGADDNGGKTLLPEEVANHLMIVEYSKGHCRIIPRQDHGLRGVGLYYYGRGPFRDDDVDYERLAPGQRVVTDIDELQGALVGPLTDAGLDYIDLSIPGSDVLDMVDRGDNIRFGSDRWRGSADLEAGYEIAGRVINNALIAEELTLAEKDRLGEIVVAQFRSGDGDFLALLAGDPSGRRAIMHNSAIQVRLMLNHR